MARRRIYCKDNCGGKTVFYCVKRRFIFLEKLNSLSACWRNQEVVMNNKAASVFSPLPSFVNHFIMLSKPMLFVFCWEPFNRLALHSLQIGVFEGFVHALFRQ